MKYVSNITVWLICLLIHVHLAGAQTSLHVGSGTTIVVSGQAQLVFGGGSFTNDGSYTDAAGTLTVAGSTSFSGTGTTNLYNLVVDHNGGSSNLGSLVSVINSATLAAGSLNTNANLLALRSDLNPNANLVNNGVLMGTLNGLLTKATATTGATAYTSTLSTNLSGSGITYQWQSSPDNVSWTDLPTATSPTYNATVNSAVYYRCQVSSSQSSYNQYTPGIRLDYTGCMAPVISAQTQSVSLVAGNPARFSVGATGTNLTYQWQVNSGNGFSNLVDNATYSGVNSATLTISAATMALNGYAYRAEVNSSACITVSTSASLTVTASRPDLAALLYVTPSTQYGTTPISVVVDVYELNSVASSGLVSVYITKDPKVVLSFAGTSTFVGGKLVQNGSWTFDGTSNPDTYVLTTKQVLVGGGKLSFGLTGTQTPANTQGSLTLSCTVSGVTGDELKMTNNTDSEKVDYFKK